LPRAAVAAERLNDPQAMSAFGSSGADLTSISLPPPPRFVSPGSRAVECQAICDRLKRAGSDLAPIAEIAHICQSVHWSRKPIPLPLV
jgi:hypothetical protein